MIIMGIREAAAKSNRKAKAGLGIIIILFVLFLTSTVTAINRPAETPGAEFWSSPDIDHKLIRFHVVGNSNSQSDQALKIAVRDAILVKVSPKLAKSRSLEESRLILKSLLPEMESIARSIVQIWGKNQEVRSDCGRFQFPTKSYGSLVLPAGEYEAVRILIGKAEGANWWCVLFPPLCFVNIEQATTIPVDAQPAVPLQKSPPEKVTDKTTDKITETEVKVSQPKNIRFWFWEKILNLIRNL
jgi:stage II sporulation protein R